MSSLQLRYRSVAGRKTASRISVDRLLTLFLVVNLVGYPLVAVFANALALQSTNYSIALRALNVLLSIILLVRLFVNKISQDKKWFIILIFLIWSCYFCRMAFDTMIVGKFLVREPIDYWIWGVGTCFLPMTAFMLQDTRKTDWLQMFFWVFGFFVLTSLLLSIYASNIVNSDLYGTYAVGRTELRSLNPISLGHVGTSTLLLTVFFLMHSPVRVKSRILLSILPLGVGFYLVLASNSRGPLFAAIAGLLFFFFAVKGKKRGLVFALFLALGVLLVPASIYLETAYNITTYSRIFGQNLFEEGNVVDRSDMYIGALSDFASSPFLGSGLEPTSGRGFPHNIIIESFMSMGIFLGLAMILLIAELFRRVIYFYRWDYRLGWAGVLAIQFVVGAQFSGSFYENTSFWVAIGMIASLSRLTNNTFGKRNAWGFS